MIEVKDLRKEFPVDAGKKKVISAVNGVSFSIGRGETFGLVGESGCGKSTLGRCILRLVEPSSGSVLYEGVDITKGKMDKYRQKMQMIFQNPYGSLDPKKKIGDIIGEPLIIHGKVRSAKQRLEKVKELLAAVGLKEEMIQRYPHEFSGGEQQRIGIARALACDPEFIVCDEPIAALDVSMQSQVVNLLEQLQKDKGLTYLFISHDLALVRHIADRIGVMYLGEMVELCPATELYERPRHPYTKALLSAVPVPDPEYVREYQPLEGEVPSPVDPPSGCRFHPRCPYATPFCKKAAPSLVEFSPGHFCACHMLMNEERPF